MSHRPWVRPLAPLLDRFAAWVRPRLEDEDVDGRPLPIGGRAAMRTVEVDGRALAAMGQGEVLELCLQTRRGAVVGFTCSPRAALGLAWFIVWRWWVCALWCGAKARLWTWALYRTKIRSAAPHALPTPHSPPRHLAP